jgi:hypothetical protein
MISDVQLNEGYSTPYEEDFPIYNQSRTKV